eukprot:m51a1_g3434 putative cation transport atpase (940) ;mRNA; f:630260-633385
MTSSSGKAAAASAAGADVELNLDNYPGLSEEEARLIFERDGPNEIEQQKPRTIFAIVWDVVREPMFLLLLSCSVVTFALKDYEEGSMLLAFVLFIIGITIYQERKTERALDALKNLSAPRAQIIRGGRQMTVAGREVVLGDTVILKEGDRVAADMILVWSMNVSADESLLTGECVPVRKHVGDLGADEQLGKPGGDDQPSCFSGSVIVSGKGVGLVRATGRNTLLGQIGKSLNTLETEKTPLEKEVKRLVIVMAIVGACAALAVFLILGITESRWLNAAVAAISLAMGLLPEEFPVVLTVFMSLGAWRISRSRVLTRRNSAIETLGACTVLCTDKTGTLTINQMMVQALWDKGTDHTFHFKNAADSTEAIDEQCHSIVEFAILASQRDPFDPMELALKRLADNKCVEAEHTHYDWELVREYPLTKEMLAMSRVYKMGDHHDKLCVAVKGAPESVGDLCHLGEADLARMRAHVNTFASMGLRVLGVARAVFPIVSSPKGPNPADLPSIQHDYEFEFIGLVAFIDPIRPSVPAAIRQAYDAGIKVVMITGDYPGTAKAIAEKIGLEPRDKVITGPELEQMSDEELSSRIKGVTIFARVVPEQKLQIVRAFKAAKEIVCMTGDGVNDAPALKAAHIGVAMGQRGTDVAREAAHLVLLDDDFSSIVRAVRLGRRIYDNLSKAMLYIISIHVPLAGMVLMPVLFHLGEHPHDASTSSGEDWEGIWVDPVFHAVHIVFLEMVIDPACSVVLEAEPEADGIMDRPPRDTSKGAVNLTTGFIAFAQGIVILAAALLLFYYSRTLTGADTEQAIALAFGAVIIANLGLIIEDRSWDSSFFTTLFFRKNIANTIVLIIVIPALFVVIYVPGINSLFRFAHVPAIYIPVFIGVGIVSSLWFEFFKLGRHFYLKNKIHRFNEQRRKELGLPPNFNEHGVALEVVEVEPQEK